MIEETLPGLTSDDLELAALIVHTMRRAVEIRDFHAHEPLPLMYAAVGSVVCDMLLKANRGATDSQTTRLQSLYEALSLMSVDFYGWFQQAFEKRLKDNFAAALGDTPITPGDFVDDYGSGAEVADSFHTTACREVCDNCAAQCPGGPDCIACDPECKDCRTYEDRFGRLPNADADRVWEGDLWPPVGAEGTGNTVLVGPVSGRIDTSKPNLMNIPVEVADISVVKEKKPRRKKARRTKKATKP